ncbi:hypothetical protein b3_0094 [Synechococcus phage B3]|nr:hypothetical protein b3_0094 [Synechococcus phage B3]QGT54708.1 hypothetical protein b23_0093 [Synechococcus phage B23]
MNHPFETLQKIVKNIRSLKHDSGLGNQIIPSISIYITDNPTYLGIVLGDWEKVLYMVKSEQMIVHYSDTVDTGNSFLMELKP